MSYWVEVRKNAPRAGFFPLSAHVQAHSHSKIQEMDDLEEEITELRQGALMHIQLPPKRARVFS